MENKTGNIIINWFSKRYNYSFISSCTDLALPVMRWLDFSSQMAIIQWKNALFFTHRPLSYDAAPNPTPKKCLTWMLSGGRVLTIVLNDKIIHSKNAEIACPSATCLSANVPVCLTVFFPFPFLETWHCIWFTSYLVHSFTEHFFMSLHLICVLVFPSILFFNCVSFCYSLVLDFLQFPVTIFFFLLSILLSLILSLLRGNHLDSCWASATGTSHDVFWTDNLGVCVCMID